MNKNYEEQSGQYEFRQEWYEEDDNGEEDTSGILLNDAPSRDSLNALHESQEPNKVELQGDNMVGENSIAPPAEDDGSVWCTYYDESSGRYYYHNRVTNETQWEEPRVQL